MKSFLQYINESKLNNTQWYFGNNRSKKLKLSQPQWYAPFFLTTDYNYAQDYSDYGVYLIDLKNESKINILDFSKQTEVNKLNWPKILVDTIKNGNNDLNSIAYDLYNLAYNDGQNLTYINDSQQWKNCANYFKVKSVNIMSQFKPISIWGTEKDHQFLLQMWKDIFDAKFNGFIHHEFGKEIIAIFTFKCIDKISVKPINNLMTETQISSNNLKNSYEPPYSLTQIRTKYPENIYNKLAQCPIHSWRANTGIELIHQEPSEEELDRIWKNWQLMPQNMKNISDKKSIELFVITNADNYSKLKAKWLKQNVNKNKNEYLKKYQITEGKQEYLKKYSNEPDVKAVIDKFWTIKQRLKTPENDIDYWIKKPYNEFKRFVLSFNMSNKKERRESNYKQDAIDNGAKLLDIKAGYEIWYVPTYEAMEILGRYYKGRSAKWCVASDDPEFWFDNHMNDEFILLIREHPQHNEFDKIALQMENHGRYYSQNEIIPWDLNNNDRTFTNDDLMHYSWLLFKDNGELRDNYLD